MDFLGMSCLVEEDGCVKVADTPTGRVWSGEEPTRKSDQHGPELSASVDILIVDRAEGHLAWGHGGRFACLAWISRCG